MVARYIYAYKRKFADFCAETDETILKLEINKIAFAGINESWHAVFAWLDICVFVNTSYMLLNKHKFYVSNFPINIWPIISVIYVGKNV